MVAGHPFKGGSFYSTGQLCHPDLKRFQINTPVLFAPPNPLKSAGFMAAAVSVPTFANFYQSYFGSAPQNLTNPKCTSFLSGMKSCFENNPG